MGRGEKSPTEIRSIRYEDMRAILLHKYKEQKVSLDKLELDEKGNPTGLNRTGLKFLDDFFKGMRLDQMGTDVFRAYRTSRTKDDACGDTTVNRDLALLRRMLVLTVEEKKLQFQVPKFPMTSEKDNVRQGFVKPAKFRELLDSMPEILRPYLLFFYETGCRPGAAKEIVWEWVNLDEGMIYIPDNTTKNGEALPVPVSVNLGRETGPKVWQYSGLIPYDLRRSAIRNMKRAGVATEVAMKISGHKTLSVFMRYNITDVEDVQGAMRKVSNYNASSIQVAVASKS
jgi:integrase